MIRFPILNEEREKSNQLLDDVLKVAQAVRDNSSKAEDYINILSQNVEVILSPLCAFPTRGEFDSRECSDHPPLPGVR